MKYFLYVIVAFGFLLIGSAASAQSQCPDNFVAFRDTTAPLSCTCPPVDMNDSSVWGMDTYTEDSNICLSAVHAGVISKQGGPVTVFPKPGQPAYPGVTRNGISSSNNGQMEGSFNFGSAPVLQPAVVPAQPVAVPVQPSTAFSQCPDNFVAFRGTTAPLNCTCPVVDMNDSNVWGMDTYTEDSNICLAAVHAGLLTKQGGNVSILPQAGRPAYAGVTRNGITSSNYGQMEGSFSFTAAVAVQPVAVPVQPVAVAPQPAVAFSQCPDNFVAFRGTSAPLTCTCPAVDMNDSNVWGMDTYTEDSNICLAAVHAGLLTKQGGNVSILPQAGRPAYAGVTRNGITSSNYGQMEGSFSFSPTVIAPAPAPQVVVAPPPAAPVQQPVAATLAQTGQVQLYINFATDSAKLYEDSYPVLNDLLGALRSDPSINLSLIGHTDAVGSADYNMALSAKRAEAVKFWLIQNGVLPSRLQTAGRGFTEPLDDNGTEYGRAVNRRVQALRIQ